MIVPSRGAAGGGSCIATRQCGQAPGGSVRESPSVGESAGKRVVRLDYEAHPALAEDALAQVAQDAAKKL